MRICIPTETDGGLKAKVHGHFGSAPYFTIYDGKNNDCEIIDNGNQHHEHGTCHPASLLNGKKVDAVICAGMGARAVQLLNDAKIKVYRTDALTVKEIIKKFEKNKLEEISVENACTQHGCH